MVKGPFLSLAGWLVHLSSFQYVQLVCFKLFVWEILKTNRFSFTCVLLFFFRPVDSVCEMTVSLSFAQSHFGLKFPVVPHDLFPPWSVSGVGVQLFCQHDKWFRELPHCSLTNRKHTRMLSTRIFHPVVCICVHLWFQPGGQGREKGGGRMVAKQGTGVERQSELGLGYPSVCKD